MLECTNAATYMDTSVKQNLQCDLSLLQRSHGKKLKPIQLIKLLFEIYKESKMELFLFKTSNYLMQKISSNHKSREKCARTSKDAVPEDYLCNAYNQDDGLVQNLTGHQLP